MDEMNRSSVDKQNYSQYCQMLWQTCDELGDFNGWRFLVFNQKNYVQYWHRRLMIFQSLGPRSRSRSVYLDSRRKPCLRQGGEIWGPDQQIIERLMFSVQGGESVDGAVVADAELAALVTSCDAVLQFSIHAWKRGRQEVLKYKFQRFEGKNDRNPWGYKYLPESWSVAETVRTGEPTVMFS